MLLSPVQKSFLWFGAGVPLVLLTTWIIEKIIGPEFPGWLGYTLNFWSFFCVLVGFVYGLLGLVGDFKTRTNTLVQNRFRSLSLLAVVSNGIWLIFDIFVLIPVIFGWI